MHRVSVAIATVMAASVAPSGGAAQEVERNVAYVADPHPEQHLDISWPAVEPWAAVVFLHGGGLDESGERRSSEIYRGICDGFVAAGVVCASADYRLSPSFRWPVMAEDAAAATALVRERVRARLGDLPLWVMGHSSGCHLAANVSANPRHLTAVGMRPEELGGVIAMGCVLDNHDMALLGVTADDLREGFARDRSYRERFGSPEMLLDANPSRHLGPHVPATLVLLAEQERFFPAILEQGARYVRLLLEADVRADLVIVPGRHMSSAAEFGAPGDPALAEVLAFMRVGGERPAP